MNKASDSDDPALEMAAQALGMEPSELEAALEEELETLKVEKEMERDLIEIRKIDPGVGSLMELGEGFFKCIEAGMDAIEAYHASRYVAKKTTPTPPAEIGKVNQSSVQKEHYTKAEVEAMTAEEVEKNLEKIEQSMKTWK